MDEYKSHLDMTHSRQNDYSIQQWVEKYSLKIQINSNKIKNTHVKLFCYANHLIANCKVFKYGTGSAVC